MRRNVERLEKWATFQYNRLGITLQGFVTIVREWEKSFAMSNASSMSPRFQVKPEEITKNLTRLLPPYKVVLFDDDYNEMTYVVFALIHSVSNLTPQEAEEIMLTAHLKGNAIVVVCPREAAEYYQERLLSYGLTATIEPE